MFRTCVTSFAMPPRETVFNTMGSQDDAGVKVTGKEFFQIMKYYNDKPFLVISAVSAVAAGVIQVVVSIIFGNMTSVLSGSSDIMDSIVKLIKQMAYVYTGIIVAMILTYCFRVTANPNYVLDLRRLIYTSIIQQEMEFFDKVPTGVLVSRLSEDVTVVRETYIDKFLQVVQNLSQSIAAVVIAFVTSWTVSFIALVGIIILIVIFVFGERAIDNLWVDFNATSTKCTSKAEEVISQFRTVKSFDCEMKEAENYKQGLDNVNEVFNRTSIAHGIKNAFVQVISNSMTASVLWLVSYLIVYQPKFKLEVGSATTLMLTLMFAVLGVSQSVSFVDEFRKANVASAKLLAIINKKPAIDRNAGEKMGPVHGTIEFKNVAFKYSTRDEYAIKDLSFKIEAGETVAFVGESGCGKTTTLQLLQRFYEIESGQILIDGVDIKTLSQVSLRSQIGVVPQTPVLFSMSVKENIAYAKDNVTDQEVADAAKIGNAHKFIMELPENYNTRVQQTSLSGGQKQRICISRAILANSPILMLDEATAALDTESEQLVQMSLESFRHGKTAIVVAHRLSTVKNADRILVFQAGKVIETGTHDDLMKKNGIYADLVHFQLQ